MPLYAGRVRVAYDNSEVNALRKGRGQLSQPVSTTYAASSLVMYSTDGHHDNSLACTS